MIDFRSDTVTQPCDKMRQAMHDAPVGDDVYGDDPTVNELQIYVADMIGTEDALFVPTGTMSNLCALMSHCERGDEFIAGHDAHCYRNEGGNASVLGSLQPQTLQLDKNGMFDFEALKSVIKPDDVHFAISKLLCIENTRHGIALPLPYLKDIHAFAKQYKLSLHLDGARAFHAAIKLKVDIKEITQYFDTISICLSKGLGAPVGSILCGSKTLIQKARRLRKMLGGGMRQAGVIASAGLYALQNNIQRLQEDHDHASYLSDELKKIEHINVLNHPLQTNMVFMELQNIDQPALIEYLKTKNIFMSNGGQIRLVLHKHINRSNCETFLKILKENLKNFQIENSIKPEFSYTSI